VVRSGGFVAVVVAAAGVAVEDPEDLGCPRKCDPFVTGCAYGAANASRGGAAVTRLENVIAWSIAAIGAGYGLFLIVYAACRG
jgi:hypothetical protein